MRLHIFYILLFSLLCMAPVYIFGFGGHDAHIHGLWTKHFSKLLAEGQSYPRLANDMYAGFGSYAFFFYPPVSLYFNSLFSFLGKDADFYYTAIAASANLGLFLSGLAAYYWLKSKLQAGYALLYALLYMVLPVHLLVDFYITAGISQFWSYAWLPLIFYGIEKTARREKYGVALLAVSLALLVMTNLPLAILFIPFAAAYALVIGKNMKHMFFAAILGAAISAVYVLPMLAYKNLVNVDLHWGEQFHYSGYFLDKKLFTDDIRESYRLTVLLCGILTFICLGFLWQKNERGRAKSFIAVVGLVVLFLCFSFSDFIWQILTPLQLIQFPRRLLVIPSVLILLAAVEREKRILIIFITVFLVASVIIAKKRSADMDSSNVAEARQDYTHGIEAFPNFIPGKDFIDQFYPLAAELEIYPQVMVSDGKVVVKKWQSGEIEFNLTAKAGTLVKVRQFYFPFWKAYIDGAEIPIFRGMPAGLIDFALDKDVIDKTVVLRLETFPMERIGNWISALGFGLLIIIVARDVRKKPL